MDQTLWIADVLDGFEQTTLSGPKPPDGPVELVLVRRRCPQPTTKAVLYVHGYVDYFFQTHLADFYNRVGLHFYALDLRRHGRSLRAYQRPNYASDIDEYLQDLDVAIGLLQRQEEIGWLLVNGHSTGGLVAALHAHRGQTRSAVKALFLNSPFLDMNLPAWQERILEPMVAALGRWLPGLVIPSPSSIYGQSLHADHQGHWRYNTQWKPIEGFPVYADWFGAIHRAHGEVAHGLSIDCPVLLMHAQRSAWPKQWSEQALTTDIVLDVADMQRLAPRLGQHVDVIAIADGVHDLILSEEAPRKQVFDHLRVWLIGIEAIDSDQQTAHDRATF